MCHLEISNLISQALVRLQEFAEVSNKLSVLYIALHHSMPFKQSLVFIPSTCQILVLNLSSTGYYSLFKLTCRDYTVCLVKSMVEVSLILREMNIVLFPSYFC